MMSRSTGRLAFLVQVAYDKLSFNSCFIFIPLRQSDDHMTCFIHININIINIDTSIPMPPNVGHGGGSPSLWFLDARIPQIGYGVTANIAASHAAARGSTPRIRITFCFCCQVRY